MKTNTRHSLTLIVLFLALIIGNIYGAKTSALRNSVLGNSTQSNQKVVLQTNVDEINLEEIETESPATEDTVPEPIPEKPTVEKETEITISEEPAADIETAPAPEEIISPGLSIEEITEATTSTKTTPETEKEQVVVDVAPGTRVISVKQKKPVEKKPSDDEKIEFQFENADMENLVTEIASLYDVTFITDDSISPIGPNGKAVKGNKISFKTQKPLTRKQGWNLFLTFLDLAGLSIIPGPAPKKGEKQIYRITSIETVRKAPIATYIGIEPTSLPDNDERIHYIYFVENSSIEAIQNILEALRSPTSALAILKDLKGFILTDKAYNIRKLMEIVKELDKVSMPQAMSVLKLRRTDAQQVKQLYESLTIKDEDKALSSRLFGPKKQQTNYYFPESVTLFAEPRTNSLIMVGTQDGIKKIEDFIIKYIDIELDQSYSPLHIYQLKYADATSIAEILQSMVQFGKDTEAGKSGGVRGIDKYLKPISFTPEKEGNRLIIRGDYDDYLKVKEVIDSLDEPQPQVAIEVLLVSVDLAKNKQLGVQLRNKVPGTNGLLGPNVNFQTSGFNGNQGIQLNSDPNVSGSKQLLANLINLAKGLGVGNTVVSLGSDATGVWGMLQLLESAANTNVLANPFLVATNKTKASVSLGETRRVVSSTVVSGSSNQMGMTDATAALTVDITPQINSDGMIILDINIVQDVFTNSTDQTNADRATKTITTKAIVADKEVLALGGLIKNNIANNQTKTPVLGNIPIFGWLFKNKQKKETKSTLLVLISTRIIEPEAKDTIGVFTKKRIDDYHDDLRQAQTESDRRDPVDRLFFQADNYNSEHAIDDFLFGRHNQDDVIKDKKPSDRKKKKDTKPTYLELINNEQKQDVRKKPTAVAQAPKKPQEPKLATTTMQELKPKLKEREHTSLANYMKNDAKKEQA